MRILFVSRKKRSDIGGLSRFTQELYRRYQGKKDLLIVPEPQSIFRIAWRKISLIHLCDASLLPLGVLLKSILHKPLTVTAHGLDICYPNKLYQQILKLVSPKAHAVILDSRPLIKLLKNLPIKIERKYVVNPGISIEHLSKKILTKGYPRWKQEGGGLELASNKIFLLTVGNLVFRKGHLWFIRKVMTKLPEKFVYLIVGEGPQKKAIQSTIKALRLDQRVFLLGQINNQQLTEVYNKADIYVCPNQKDKGNFEGFGIAAGEAAAMGLPVIASRVDGIPQVIHNGKNGWLVDPTAREFVKALLKLRNKNLRRRLGAAAEKYTKENFSWEKTVKQYKEVFKEVIKALGSK